MASDRHTHTHTRSTTTTTTTWSIALCVHSVQCWCYREQSIISLMGMWSATLVTPCWCSVIRVECNSEWGSVFMYCWHEAFYRCVLMFVFFQKVKKTLRICHTCSVISEKSLTRDYREIHFYCVLINDVQVCVPQVEDGWYRLTQFPDWQCWRTV